MHFVIRWYDDTKMFLLAGNLTIGSPSYEVKIFLTLYHDCVVFNIIFLFGHICQNSDELHPNLQMWVSSTGNYFITRIDVLLHTTFMTYYRQIRVIIQLNNNG